MVDCLIVARGCYCGPMPIVGVNRSNAEAAKNCEFNAGASCALACARAPGRVAEDGKNDVDGGTLQVEAALALRSEHKGVAMFAAVHGLSTGSRE